MLNIVYTVYHDTNKEARSMELLHCCQLIGNVDFVSYAKPADVENIRTHIIDKNSLFALFHFLRTAKKVINEVKPDIVVLHDNDCAVLIPFLMKKHPQAKIVYDSSELYINKKVPGNTVRTSRFANGVMVWLKEKITSFRPIYEKKFLRYADLVIAANKERANIMKEYFELKKMPIIFDNIHRIDDNYDENACKQKFKDIIYDGKFNILFGGGLSEERKTFDYIQAFNKLDDRFNLVIAGSASPVALSRFHSMQNDANKDRIHYIGFITRAELRYCMKTCQASVVVFDKESYNTVYCASGKCYESLFEGTPILASENPPLKRLCDEYHVGISDDDYANAIMCLYQSYTHHCDCVRKYIESIDYDSRVLKLSQTISAELSISLDE